MNICSKCGSLLPEHCNFCPACGAIHSAPSSINLTKNGFDSLRGELTNRAFMKIGKERTKGRIGEMAMIFIVYLVVITVFSAIPVIGTIGTILIGGSLAIGMTRLGLNLLDDHPVSLHTLLEGFTPFLKNMQLYLTQWVLLILWCLLLIIPTFIKVFSYAMVYYIRLEFPHLSAMETITKSREMMDGHKWRLACLYFSFFWWFLFGVITCGIGFFWVAPRFMTAKAAFYRNLILR